MSKYVREIMKENTNTDTDAKDKTFPDEQEIRERKKTTDKDHQELINSPSKKNPKDTDVKKIDDIYYQLNHKFSQQPLKFKIGLTCAFVLIIAIIWLILLSANLPSSFFRNFADTTNNIFEEINSVELPAASTIMEHTVACRKAANMIQRSPAFKSYGSHIATGLREFGEKIKETGHLLQKMYSKGSSVYKEFDIEIEAMMNRLNSNLRQGDARYFKERLNNLITKIKDFRQLVVKTLGSIHNAEDIRHDTEGYIFDGLREAEKFIDYKRKCNSVDISKTKEELEVVNNILNHLHNTAVRLDKMEKILKDYEDKLIDVSAELDNVGKDDDDIFEVTKSDLKYLKLAIDNSKASLYKFNKQAQVS